MVADAPPPTPSLKAQSPCHGSKGLQVLLPCLYMLATSCTMSAAAGQEENVTPTPASPPAVCLTRLRRSLGPASAAVEVPRPFRPLA